MDQVAEYAIAMLLERFPRAAPVPRNGLRYPVARNPRFLGPCQLLSLPWVAISGVRVTATAFFAPPEEFFAAHPLAAATLKPTTHWDYFRALSVLREHIGPTAVTFAELDAVVESFANSLYEDDRPGTGKQVIANIMCCAMSRVPSTAPHFYCVRRALSGWKRKSSPKQALPRTRQMVLAFVGFFLEHEDVSLAVCVAVSWGGLLRGNEARALRKRDIALRGDAHLSDCPQGTAGVLVREVKTGRMQVSTLDDPLICQIPVKFMSTLSLTPSSRPFDFGYARFLQGMRHAAVYFGLNPTRVTTHSCRQGGALSL